jgi:hypothetical protein
MPIPFSCPHCGNQSNVAEQYAGQTGPCAGCGQKITIPPVVAGKKSSISGAMIAIIIVVAGLGSVMLLGAVLLPAVQAARFRARRMQSAGNMKQIVVALHNYHDTYNTLPPAYIPNNDGTRRTSWRVLVLPYLEHNGVYQQYAMGQSWDHPANATVRQLPMAVYRDPNSVSANARESSYLLITGKGTAFDGASTKKFSDMLNGTSNIALAVEVQGHNIEWTEPMDVDISDLPQLIKSGTFRNSGTATVMMADGSVRQMPLANLGLKLQAMARIADGE